MYKRKCFSTVPGKKMKTLIALLYSLLQSLSSQYMGKQVYSPVSATVVLTNVRRLRRSCWTILQIEKKHIKNKQICAHPISCLRHAQYRFMNMCLTQAVLHPPPHKGGRSTAQVCPCTSGSVCLLSARSGSLPLS